MRKIRDILRLRLSAGLSIREISRSTKISVGGIQKLPPGYPLLVILSGATRNEADKSE